MLNSILALAVLKPSGKAVSQPAVLPLGDIPHAEPGRTCTLITRCNSLLTCLCTMIRYYVIIIFNYYYTIVRNTKFNLFSVGNNGFQFFFVNHFWWASDFSCHVVFCLSFLFSDFQIKPNLSIDSSTASINDYVIIMWLFTCINCCNKIISNSACFNSKLRTPKFVPLRLGKISWKYSPAISMVKSSVYYFGLT